MADTSTAPARPTTPAGRRTIRLVDEDLDALRSDVEALAEQVAGSARERAELVAAATALTGAVDRLVELLGAQPSGPAGERPTAKKHKAKKHKGPKKKTKK